MLKKDKLFAALLLMLGLCVSARAQNEKPAAYGILMDNTGSLRSQLQQVITLGTALVERTVQRGPTALFHFATTGDKKKQLAVVVKGTDWSQDEAVLENYINELYVVPGQTALWDAIRSMAEDMKANGGSAAPAEKIIILITDGEDKFSKIKEKQLIEELKKENIKVYAVGLVQELAFEGGLVGRSPKAKAVDFLKKLTKETGGRAVFPDSSGIDAHAVLNELFSGVQIRQK